jgi:hypothetical protein
VDAFPEHDLDHVQALVQEDDVKRLTAAGDTYLDFSSFT